MRKQFKEIKGIITMDFGCDDVYLLKGHCRINLAKIFKKFINKKVKLKIEEIY